MSTPSKSHARATGSPTTFSTVKMWVPSPKVWLTLWIGFVLVGTARSELHNPLYHDLGGLNWMGAAYMTLHHLIAIGTVDFIVIWFLLLVPPLLVVVVRRVAIMFGPRPRT
jgi:hypothetical protein